MVSRIPDDTSPSPAREQEPQPDVFVLGRAAVRDVDRLAVEVFGIPSIVLMENAAFHIADVALHLLREARPPRILIVCGPGNNGGDGLAAARHLHNAGAVVEIVTAVPDGAMLGDAATNLKIARKMGLPITTIDTGRPAAAVEQAIARLGEPGLIVDALLGTGLTSPVREPSLSLIEAINAAARDRGITVLAVDIPSGLDTDTGQPLGAAVRADVTVSMVGLKTGFTTLTAQGYVGDVVVADIGAPRELAARLGTPLKAQELPDLSIHRPERGPGSSEEAGPAQRRGDA